MSLNGVTHKRVYLDCFVSSDLAFLGGLCTGLVAYFPSWDVSDSEVVVESEDKSDEDDRCFLDFFAFFLVFLTSGAFLRTLA